MARNQRRSLERSTTKVDLVRQAILSAESSLELAKRLLGEIGAGSGSSVPGTREIEGVVGTFDGKFMITEDGKKYQIPENYASKTRLVCGDKLKMYQEGGESKFKQIERVKRKQLGGILAKKEGKPVVITAEGSFNLIPAAVKHFEAQEGDQLEVLIPAENKHAPFAALEINKSLKLRQEAESEKKKEDQKEGRQTPPEGSQTSPEIGKEKKEEVKEKKSKSARAGSRRIEPRKEEARDTKAKEETAEEKPSSVLEEEDLR